MSFPLNPVNGQTTVTNNISYVYNSAGTGYWTRTFANTATIAGTPAALLISNSTSATSTTTGALQVVGGVGIGGTLYVGSLRGDATTSATTWGLFYNVVTKEITTATGSSGSGSGISSTGTTSTFTILSTANSFNTSTGALQVRGGAGIAGNLNVGGISTLTGGVYTSIIYDIADTSNSTYLWPTDTSKIVGLSARGSEVFAGNDTQIGTISVTRGGITAANSATYYGLYNRSNSFATGIGVDVNNNLWFGRVTGGGSASTRQSNYFYSDSSGNVYAGSSFRSNIFYAANNSAYFLDLTTTATNHAILSNAVSANLIGYDPALGVYIGGTDNRYLTNGTTSSGGPLWVMTGTTYNLIHSGNITQYAAVNTTTFTNPILIRINNTDVSGATATTHLTLANPNTGAASSGIYWRFANQSDVRASIRVNDSGDIIYNSLSGNYRFQQEFGSSATSFSNSTTNFMSVDGIGNMTFPKNIYAAKLFDYNDNTYFVDPNSTSTINQLTMKGLFTATVTGTAGTWTDVVLATSNLGGTYISANRPAASTGDVGYKWMTGGGTVWTNYLPANDAYTLTWGLNGVKQFTMNSAGNMSTQVTGAAIGSPQFYDANNSSYYLKPSGYSYLNSLNLGGTTVGISTGTGIRVFNNNSNNFTSTVFWGVPTLSYFWNWQIDNGGNAALWGYPYNNTSTRVLTVTPSGNWGFNQSSLPGDVDMIGGISVTGTGTTQMSVMKGSTSGFSMRVSDSVYGDFSLYDNAQGSWKLALNARRGSVGINTTATTTYGLTVAGDVNFGGNIYQNGALYTNNLTTTTFTANGYAWYATSSTGFGSTLFNTFETAAIAGPDYILGSGTLVDLLAWNFPTTTEYYNGASASWVLDATDVKPLFNGQRALIGTINNNYSFTGISKQGVRFTWTTFGVKSWDALVITGNTANQVLDATLESSSDNGSTIITHVNRATLGYTGGQGRLFLRTQQTNTGTWFRLTIRESIASATAVNLFNISLLGTTGAGLRLLNWDNQRNITTYGNLTTNVVYDTNNSSYYLSPTKTSNLYTATLAGDILTQGQGRFTGWQNSPSVSTRTAGFGVEIGVNAGAGGISAYDRTLSAYGTLGVFGSPIRIIPQTTATVYIGGQWVDNDDTRFFVKPSTGTVITNLKAFGPVQFVNTGGNSYNENIRLPRAADGISMISMASDISGSGNILGQWNLVVQPATTSPNFGQFSILNGSTTAFSLATATNTATFAANVYAPKYLQSNGTSEAYYLQPNQTSYLSALKVGDPYTAAVLTVGPLDDYLNTFTYVHTAIGGIDTAKDLNIATLANQSYVGSFNVNANAPAGSDLYALYQAQHRGGAPSGTGGSAGTDYSSQIVIPLISDANSVNVSRLFFRAKKNTVWQSWNEVLTVGSKNSAQNYNIYVQTITDSTNSAYNINPSASTTLNNLTLNGSLIAYLTGTPTVASPKLGAADWVYPSTTDSNIGTSVGNAGLPAGNRTIYRNGLYTWKTASATGLVPTTIGPGFTAINPYFAAVGFGAGNGAAEIAAYLLPGGAATDQAQGLYFRTLRDNGSSPWAKWVEVLNTSTHAYAAVLNQNLRTSDSPTFSSISLTNAPTFGQVIAKSYWITGGGNNKGKIVLPWNSTFAGGGAGAIGPYYANATTDLASFRFDEVSSTVGAVATGGEQGYLSNPNISIYIGANKVIGSSGGEAWHTTMYSLADTSYRVVPNATSQINALEVKNGITFTGDNLSAGQSAKLNLTPGRGIIDASFSLSSGAATAVGTVATFGTGLNGYNGYVIGGNSTAGVYDASFIKNLAGPDWGIRSGNGNQWAIYANGGDGSTAAKVARMSLNASSGALVNASYAVSVLGTLYCTQNIYAFSDKRKKTNIATIDNALGKVLQLRGVYYHRIDPEPEDEGRREVGVIAQEVLEVLPEAVKHSDHTDEYSVNYGNMAGIFIEAIKDLKKELDELKAELNMLKGNK